MFFSCAIGVCCCLCCWNTRLLDREFDNVASKARLWTEQARLHQLEQAVQAAIHNENETEFQAALAKYQQATLQQLVKVEHVMMSKLHHMSKQHQDDMDSLKQIMIKEVIALIVQNVNNDNNDNASTMTDVGNQDMEHFVKYANHILERHGQTMPWARLWDHALWAMSTQPQWEQYNRWIQETVSESLYHDIQDVIQASQ